MSGADAQPSTAALAALRARVTPSVGAPPLTTADAAFLTDATLARFLLARRGDVDAAARQLRATLAWRRDHIRAPLRCAPCEVDATTHCVVPLGLTAGGHPIVYGCPAKGRSVEGGPTVGHVVSVLEHVFALPDVAGAPVADQWVWVVDFSGFGWRDVSNIGIGVGFASVLPHHYPERLHRIVMINRPAVFSVLLGVMHPFLDARTLDKLVGESGDADTIGAALEARHGFSAAAAAWVADAMRRPARPGLDALPPLPPEAAPLQLPRGGECDGAGASSHGGAERGGDGGGPDGESP